VACQCLRATVTAASAERRLRIRQLGLPAATGTTWKRSGAADLCHHNAAEELLAEVAGALAPGEQLGVPLARAQALWLAGHDPSLFTPHVSGAASAT
jgi:hypothetical protein